MSVCYGPETSRRSYQESNPYWRADFEDGQFGNVISAERELTDADQNEQQAPETDANRTVFHPVLHLVELFPVA